MVMARFGSLADPPATFALAGVRVIDPATNTDAVRDLVVADGLIRNGAAPSGIPRINAAGLVAAPGLC
ncbi:MAG TPA: hypothetical protein VMK30_00650, partial [Pleomorphomonadaceae bacterium]|nr:hypothetical protein [Pleomorphomonadaceae bacterium]